jgi:hypothetical protein
MLACDKLPIFSHFADMELLDLPIVISNKNINDLFDFAIYKVHTECINEHDLARYIVFNKSVCLYYGKYLKEVIRIMPHTKIKIVEKIEAYKTIDIDWSSDLKRLYSCQTLSETQKKLIPNSILGCLDKAESSQITGDCFYSKNDADQFYNSNEGVSRLVLKSNKSCMSWDECIKTVEGQLITELSSWDKHLMINSIYEESKPTIHVNVIRKSSSEYNEGFLPLSLMKYNHSRISALKMWIRASKSHIVIPIGVKTDCIFVARYNYENYVRFYKLLEPNAEFDERLRVENEAVREEEARKEAVKTQTLINKRKNYIEPAYNVYNREDKSEYEKRMDREAEAKREARRIQARINIHENCIGPSY